MPSKFLIYLFLTIGSVAGSFVPMIFGAGILSYWSALGSGIGALIGIYLAFKVAKL